MNSLMKPIRKLTLFITLTLILCFYSIFQAYEIRNKIRLGNNRLSLINKKEKELKILKEKIEGLRIGIKENENSDLELINTINSSFPELQILKINSSQTTRNQGKTESINLSIRGDFRTIMKYINDYICHKTFVGINSISIQKYRNKQVLANFRLKRMDQKSLK